MTEIPPGADLSLIPIAKPPNPNLVPNLKGKGQLEDTTIAVCVVVIALQLLFLGIRFFTKIKAKTRLAYDDSCALVAAILSFGLCYCTIFNRAQGRHMWDISVALALDKTRAKVSFASLMLIGPAVFMGKITLLALYLKLFGHMSKVRWSIYAVSVFALTILVMTPLDAVKCGRAPGQDWGSSNPACSETFLYGVVQGIVSLLIDLFILILPVPIIMGLNLRKRKRYGVLVIFLTGIVAVVADIIVMKFRVDLYTGKDPAWAGFLITLCSIVETGISVVCSSMPTLAKFGRQHALQWGYFVSLRSYFTSRRSDGSTPSARSTGYPKPKPHKRPDPYSINMPTENSVTQLHSNGGNDYIELYDHGHLVPAKVGEIKKTMNIEQSSTRCSNSSVEQMV